MKYSLVRLENGLRVVTIPMPSLESATVTVWVKTGSRNELARVAGISHFLEHMVFKGSKKRPSARAISEAVDAIGGEFNAATAKEWTNFYIKAQKNSLPVAFDVLADMVLNPLLNSRDIEKEKGVVCEEMAMYEDTPIYKIGEIFEQTAFKGNVLGRDTIGSEDTVKAIKRNDIQRYINTYYYSDNMVLTVAGGINQKQVIDLAEKHFGGVGKKEIESTIKDKFVSRQKSPQVLVKNKKNEQVHFILGFVGSRRDAKTKYIEAVTSSILGGGMSSRMFTEVREKRGLAYAVKVYSDHFVDTGEFVTYAGVDPSKTEEAIKVMLDQYYGLASQKYKISDSEFKKAKEYLKGQSALVLEDTKDVTFFYGERALFGLKLHNPDEIYREIDKVRVDDIYKFASEVFLPNRLNLAIIGPLTDKDKFEKLLK